MLIRQESSTWLHWAPHGDSDVTAMRPPSPPPVYDKGGNRLNTRDVRIRRGWRRAHVNMVGTWNILEHLGTSWNHWNHWNHGIWILSSEFHRVAARKAMTSEYNRLIRLAFGTVFFWEVRCTTVYDGVLHMMCLSCTIVQCAQVHDQACRWIPATCWLEAFQAHEEDHHSNRSSRAEYVQIT